MNFGLWFLPVVAIGTVGTILAASLPVPPSLPGSSAETGPVSPMAPPTRPPMQTAAVSPAAPPMQAAAAAPAAPTPRAIMRPREVTAAVTAPSAGPKHLARRHAGRLAKAAPDHHPRTLVHAVGPRYGTIVPTPPSAYAAMPMREPTQIAMAPPPYAVPPPYWRAPYRPY
jgi:hypothetical protein